MNRLKAMTVACWVTVGWTGLGSGQTGTSPTGPLPDREDTVGMTSGCRSE